MLVLLLFAFIDACLGRVHGAWQDWWAELDALARTPQLIVALQLEALLDDWEARNTRTIVAQCALPAETIGEAVGNFFKCFLNPDLFDRGLDFAVREWSRRDGAVRQRIDQADRERLAAVIQMFERHGFTPYEADVRARILYYMQLGYHALDVREPMQARCDRLAGYLKGFTGQEASDEVLATMIAYAMEQDGKQ